MQQDWKSDLDRLASAFSDLEGRGPQAAEYEQTVTELADTRRQLAVTRKALADARGHVFDLTRGAQVLEERIDEVCNRQQQIAKFVEDHAPSLDLLLGRQGRYVSRLAAADELHELVAMLAVMSEAGEDDVTAAVSQAYRLMFELEIRGLGRIAGSVPNILGKLSAITLLRPASGEVLEIGTLFGIGAAAIARQLSRQGLDNHVTIVDPFAGYQIQVDRDDSPDVSRTPATHIVVEENLALAGVRPDRFRLIEGLSTSPEVRAQASDRAYGLIIIDGDHSADVAFNDLVWAESVTAPGALVILDDYRDESWPGVEEALDRYLARPESRLTMLGAAATTAFLRA